MPKEVDLGPPYTHCLTDTQLRNELSSFISINKLPTGPTQLYLLVLPHKVDTCFDQRIRLLAKEASSLRE